MRILDNFNTRGIEIASFTEENKIMAEITEDIVVRGSEITFLSYCDLPAFQKPDRVAFHRLTAETVSAYLSGAKLPYGHILREKFGSEDVIKEMAETSNLCMIIRDKLYVVSSLAIPTITLRAEVKGDMTIQRSNLIRNLHIADAIFDKNENIHIVFRSETINGTTVRKVFAGLGSAYKLIPQTILTDTIEQLSKEGTLGRVEMSTYEIDHLFSTATVSLPEIGEEIAEEYKVDSSIVPGLVVSTSDVGASSVIIRGIYRKGNSQVITDEVMVKHAGDITPQRILSDADKQIFDKLRKLPETLSELIGREITDYSKLDLTNEEDAERNMAAVSKILEDEVKYVCKEAKVSGKKRDQLLECMVSEINSSIHYTLYDIALNFIGIPERIEGLDRDTIVRLQKACGQVPYRLEKRKIKDEEEVITLLSD